MPMRTLEPETSITSMTVSSPSMTFSPGRRVMMSMGTVPPWSRGELERCSGCYPVNPLGSDLGSILREERSTDRSVGSLVDDLMACTLCDQDRRAEIGTEVFQDLAGAHGHVDRGLIGVVDADAVGLVVGQLDLVAGEEAPRVRERQREVGVLERVQPHERGLLAAGEQGVTPAPEADEAVRELDDRLVGDLERPEAGRLKCEGLGGHGGGTASYRRKSRSDGWMIDAPDRSAAWYVFCWLVRSRMAFARSVSSVCESSVVVVVSTSARRDFAESSRAWTAPTVARVALSASWLPLRAARSPFRSVSRSAVALDRRWSAMFFSVARSL